MGKLKIVVVAIIMAASLTLGALTYSASAATMLGDINVSAACQRQRFTAHTVIVWPGNAFSWRCNAAGLHLSVDMNRACRDQYGDTRAWANTLDASHPFSWRCFR